MRDRGKQESGSVCLMGRGGGGRERSAARKRTREEHINDGDDSLAKRLSPRTTKLPLKMK